MDLKDLRWKVVNWIHMAGLQKCC